MSCVAGLYKFITILIKVVQFISTNLFFAKFGDLLLYHTDLPVNTFHILDQLLFGEASWNQIQISVHMDRTHRRDGLQLPNGTSTLLQKPNRDETVKSNILTMVNLIISFKVEGQTKNED